MIIYENDDTYILKTKDRWEFVIHIIKATRSVAKQTHTTNIFTKRPINLTK